MQELQSIVKGRGGSTSLLDSLKPGKVNETVQKGIIAPLTGSPQSSAFSKPPAVAKAGGASAEQAPRPLLLCHVTCFDMQIFSLLRISHPLPNAQEVPALSWWVAWPRWALLALSRLARAVQAAAKPQRCGLPPFTAHHAFVLLHHMCRMAAERPVPTLVLKVGGCAEGISGDTAHWHVGQAGCEEGAEGCAKASRGHHPPPLPAQAQGCRSAGHRPVWHPAHLPR